MSRKETASNSLSILSFNVENLFDTEHDLGKLDYTYLPLQIKNTTLKQSVQRYCGSIARSDWRKDCLKLDWNQKRYEEKLLRVARVIEESTSGCPDVVVLQEIENEKVLKKLNSLLLCNYKTLILSDDRDARGIDVGILSRFDARSTVNHTVPFKYLNNEEKKDTRAVLEVELFARNYAVRILGVHLPAPFHPASSRVDAIKYIEKVFSDDPLPTIIAGDWNVPDDESLSLRAIDSLRKNFFISDDIVRASSTDKGTSYYAKNKTWSFLDKVALSRNSFDAPECRVVHYFPGQRDPKLGIPLGYDPYKRSPLGVSDHFPVLCKTKY